MQGVGAKLIQALREECTSAQPDQYALRRLAALIDTLDDLPEARPLIASAYHHALSVAERRRQMAIAE